MNKKYLFLASILFAVLLVSGCVNQATNNQNQPETMTNEESTPTEDQEMTYSTAEVSTHNSEEDCWAIINNEVYDLTTWIGSHPGGMEAIIQLCGTDGSDLFNNQHGGFAQAKEKLADFKIGQLAN